MSKWNKCVKEPTEQFLQNEERRRQMIIEASKRRREKEKKLQELNENMRRNQQEALERQKREKQQAYQKYLKSNNNMHDKYEQMKRNNKLQDQPEKKDVSKWKKRDNSVDNNSSDGNSLYKDGPKSQDKKAQTNTKISIQMNQKPDLKLGSHKKAIQAEFEKEWGEDSLVPEQLLASKLLDSLDLDGDTIERGRQIIQSLKKMKNNQKQIEKDEVDEIKNLIGYQSMLASQANYTEYSSLKQIESSKNLIKNQIPAPQQKKAKLKQNVSHDKKQANEQEAFNNLKNKKEGKILQWAGNQTDEADDLFSNCSTQKNLLNKLKQNSKDNKGQKKRLDAIPEKPKISSNKLIEKEEKRSVEKIVPLIPTPSIKMTTKSNSISQTKNTIKSPPIPIPNQIQPQPKRVIGKNHQQIQISKGEERVVQLSNQNKNHNRSVSKEKPKPTVNVFQKQKQRSLEKLRERKFATGSVERASSVQKKRAAPQNPQPHIPKTQQPFRVQKPQAVNPQKNTFTVATHEQYFDVQSFIMNDLLQLNEQQMNLQNQIKNIHIESKNKVKEIKNKYQIRTNYQTSTNLIRAHEGKGQIELSYAKINAPLSEDMIEDSIQRLDDFILRKDIQSRENTHVTEESQIKSIINPLSKPEDLQRQILQLASNISKFENQPQRQPRQAGYGMMHKQKKKIGGPIISAKLQIPQEISVSTNIDEAKLMKQNAKGSQKVGLPPQLSYSIKDKSIVDFNLQQQYFDPEDSLDTMKRQKVQVNQKLRNMLFDD